MRIFFEYQSIFIFLGFKQIFSAEDFVAVFSSKMSKQKSVSRLTQSLLYLNDLISP